MAIRSINTLGTSLIALLMTAGCDDGNLPGDGGNISSGGGTGTGATSSGAQGSGGGNAAGGGSRPTTAVGGSEASGGVSSAAGASPSEGTGGGIQASQCASEQAPYLVLAQEENNYIFESSLSLNIQKVAPKTMLDLDWSQLSKSFLQQDIDASSDLDMVALVVWNLSPEEVAQKINSNDPTLDGFAEAAILFNPLNGETSAGITDFTSFGGVLSEEDLLPYLDPEVRDPATTSYTLMPSKGKTVGQGVQMIQAFQLDAASTNTEVIVTDGSTQLVWEADLEALSPTLFPPANADVVVDWTDLPTTGFGAEFIATQITEVFIARYALTLPELESQFLQIENIAEELYQAPVPSGTSIHLSTLTNEAGVAFPGISGDGIWLVGLLCPSCINPTPWYISVVESCQ